MATSHLSTLVENLLQDSVDRLRIDLSVLERQIHADKESLYISHNGKDALIVSTNLKYKAYIPKKYDGWEVTFQEKKEKDIQIDIDTQIELDF